METTYQEVSIDQIDIPENRVRTQLNDEKLEELAQSIREHGLLEPVLLTKENERYKVLCGARRIWACRMCGKVLIPARIIEVTDDKKLPIEIVENIMREDLNIVDEANALNSLFLDTDNNIEQTCKLTRKSKGYIQSRIQILEFPEDIQNALASGNISLSVAQELIRCTDKTTRTILLQSAINGGCTARAMSLWVGDWRASQNQPITKNEATAMQQQELPPTHIKMRCQCCNREMEPAEIRTLILCPRCMEAVKKAISEPQPPPKVPSPWPHPPFDGSDTPLTENY